MNEQEVQRKLIYLQQLQGEAENLQRRIVEMELLLSEYNKTLETLEFFNSIDGSVEVLMNLGGGVFAYVDVKENKKFLIDIGAGIVAEREVSEAIEFIKSRIAKVEDTIQKASAALRGIVEEATKIQNELASYKEESDVQKP
ncbi:MAG: prefoldin subunit alpha [Archaeoglobales archaeon]|nr:prefoldin subunit alpha [Archaeoglobales archaeon]